MSERANKQVRELANHVQLLQDELLLLNMHHSALMELLIEGRPITRDAVNLRQQQILTACQQEWAQKMEPGEPEPPSNLIILP